MKVRRGLLTGTASRFFIIHNIECRKIQFVSNAGNPIEEYATFHQLAFVVTDAVRQEYVS